MPKTYEFTLAGEQLVARADRSLWWSAQQILFIADLHAGKTCHFQSYGQAVPDGSLQADLQRLQQAVDELRPQRLIVLGDLFHSDINDEWQTVTDWIKQQVCSVELVRGNHDRFIDDATFQAGGLSVHDEGLQLGVFMLRHHPLETGQTAVLCGHLHPAHKFRGPGGDSLRLPCFVITERQIILPAFGSFTGAHEVGRQAGRLIGTSPDFESLVVSS